MQRTPPCSRSLHRIPVKQALSLWGVGARKKQLETPAPVPTIQLAAATDLVPEEAARIAA